MLKRGMTSLFTLEQIAVKLQSGPSSA